MTRPTTRELASTAPAATLIGVLCAGTLLVLSALAEALRDLLWDRVPDALGLDAGGWVPWWWTVAVLTATGLVVGTAVMVMPGHAGHDPAATGLVAAPVPVSTLPGLAVALVVGLAGGVSLGPENPIIAVNVALAVALLARRGSAGGEHTTRGMAWATAGTIGALFATPVAAALVLTETIAGNGLEGDALLDRLFPPLTAAAAGALTMTVAGAPTFAVELAPYATAGGWDLLSAPLIAVAATLVVGAGALLLPVTHHAFHSLPNPVLALGLGGLVLGVLGAVGGEVTLFKGLDEMKDLASTADERTWAGLLLVAGIKVVALLLATASGFRGGRIFPAVFIGVALGLAASALVPAVPPALAVAAGVMGAVIAVDRDGWIALFLAAITVGDVTLLPLLCLTLAPLWLVARGLPDFRVTPPQPGQPEFGARAAAAR